jgi:BioD-like phosphotransacetylase family protein
MRQIYLAATSQNSGKTTVSLGLLAALIDRGLPTGFIKPVGQRQALLDGVPADEDAILMKHVFGLPDSPFALSPVHIPRGFTKAFIEGKVVEDLGARILAAYAAVSVGRDVLLVEGTGHAGVGAVIGLSNADVARMLGARALIVSEAGVGRPIDEIVLNRALFARHGVDVVGAVVNKVDVEAHPSLRGVLERGLERHGIELLGVLPYRPLLSHPTLAVLVEQMKGELIHPGPDLDRPVDRFSIAAMRAEHAMQAADTGGLVIVPGDREDVIGAAAATAAAAAGAQAVDSGLSPRRAGIAGLVLTGGYRPSPLLIDEVRRSDLFCLLLDLETYDAASRIHDLLVKTHSADTEKIETIKELVAENLDVDRILERFAEPIRT